MRAKLVFGMVLPKRNSDTWYCKDEKISFDSFDEWAAYKLDGIEPGNYKNTKGYNAAVAEFSKSFSIYMDVHGYVDGTPCNILGVRDFYIDMAVLGDRESTHRVIQKTNFESGADGKPLKIDFSKEMIYDEDVLTSLFSEAPLEDLGIKFDIDRVGWFLICVESIK